MNDQKRGAGVTSEEPKRLKYTKNSVADLTQDEIQDEIVSDNIYNTVSLL